jgi:hypothetical protein
MCSKNRKDVNPYTGKVVVEVKERTLEESHPRSLSHGQEYTTAVWHPLSPKMHGMFIVNQSWWLVQGQNQPYNQHETSMIEYPGS